ncbi:hypothetical protein Plhal304r1_c011g0044001 [Plasmopara halstedii]
MEGTNGILLLGSELGVGVNALVSSLVGLHMLALFYWVYKLMQESSNSSKRASIKKRQ